MGLLVRRQPFHRRDEGLVRPVEVREGDEQGDIRRLGRILHAIVSKVVVLRVGRIQRGVLQVLQLQLEPAQVDPTPILVLRMVEVAGAIDVVDEYLHLLRRYWAAEHVPIGALDSIRIV